MGEYAILIIITVIAVVVLSTIIAYRVGRDLGELYGSRQGFNKGFDKAKEIFHDEPKQEEKEREQRTIDANTYTPQITSETLMAYGVGSTSQLPKDVRAHYGILDEDVHLQDLIEEEFNNGI